MSSIIRFVLAGLILAGSIPETASAEPTEVTVRVVARGALFVGDLVEGAHVTITDAESGELLAQGVTRGQPGEANKIMGERRLRGAPFAGSADAAFTATLDLAEPRYVEVTAFGPLQRRESATRTSMTQWVVPGKHVTGGDGWVLELAGLAVSGDLRATTVTLAEAGAGVTIEAEVLPMCGCPIRPGFFWEPQDYEVAALVRRGEEAVGRYPLRYADSANDFAGTFAVELPGVYDITVYAYDPASGNTGVDRLTLTVTGE